MHFQKGWFGFGVGSTSSLAFKRESDRELEGEGWSSGAQNARSPSSFTLNSASTWAWFDVVVLVWYKSVHPIGSTGIMNFKFGWSWSLKGSFVTDVNSKLTGVIGREGKVGGRGEVWEVSGMLTWI